MTDSADDIAKNEKDDLTEAAIKASSGARNFGLSLPSVEIAEATAIGMLAAAQTLGIRKK